MMNQRREKQDSIQDHLLREAGTNQKVNVEEEERKGELVHHRGAEQDLVLQIIPATRRFALILRKENANSEIHAGSLINIFVSCQWKLQEG